MKHITFGTVLTFVLTCSLIIFVSSCKKVETDNGDSYYISFDIGVEQFEFLLGCTELEEHAWVSEINESSPVDLHFFATPNVETCLTEPDNYMWIAVRNAVVGATGSYTTVDVYYKQDGIYYFLQANTSALLEITDYGAIGEVIKGSFSATLFEHLGGPSSSIEITNGAFSTIRTADNNYPPFD